MTSIDSCFEVPIHCTPTTRTKSGNKILLYIDISLAKELNASSELSHLSFDNFYVSSIGIAVQLGTAGFIPALEDRVLMPTASCESGSQDHYTVYMNELSIQSTNSLIYAPANLRSLKVIRVFVIQPCPQWEIFELRHIKVFAKRISLELDNSRDKLSPLRALGTQSRPGFADSGISRAEQPQNICSMVSTDIEFLLEAKKKQQLARASVSTMSAEFSMDRYKSGDSKKKDKKKRYR